MNSYATESGANDSTLSCGVHMFGLVEKQDYVVKGEPEDLPWPAVGQDDATVPVVGVVAGEGAAVGQEAGAKVREQSARRARQGSTE